MENTKKKLHFLNYCKNLAVGYDLWVTSRATRCVA